MAPVVQEGRCMFLELPPELRNRIYSLVVTADAPILLNPKTARDKKCDGHERMAKKTSVYAKMQYPAITQASRQIREESDQMFMANNRFAYLILLRGNSTTWKGKSICDSIRGFGLDRLKCMQKFGLGLCHVATSDVKYIWPVLHFCSQWADYGMPKELMLVGVGLGNFRDDGDAFYRAYLQSMYAMAYEEGKQKRLLPEDTNRALVEWAKNGKGKSIMNKYLRGNSAAKNLLGKAFFE